MAIFKLESLNVHNIHITGKLKAENCLIFSVKMFSGSKIKGNLQVIVFLLLKSILNSAKIFLIWL